MNQNSNDNIENKKKVIVIAGPTASGKTAVSVQLAKRIESEIVSADSVQVYKELDIGSAKIKDYEKEGIIHYMIDEVDADVVYSMYDFKIQADVYMNQIFEKNKIPIIAGGTGFYIQSLLKDIELNNEDIDNNNKNKKDNDITKELYEYAKINGNDKLHEMLKEIDEVSYNNIHPNNVKRVVRAIEYYKKNNTPISQHNEREKERENKYDVKFIVLYFKDKELLYKRVEKRVDEMVSEGLFEEVAKIYDKLSKEKDMQEIIKLTSMQAIGYKEVLEYINGNVTKEEAINQIKINTRHLVKRQYTWFRHQVDDAIWIAVDEFNYDINKIIDYILKIL